MNGTEAHDIKIGAVRNWLKTQTEKSDGIKKTVKRWNRCV